MCLPAYAQAHAPIQGLNEFANGFVHPFLTPPHLLVLLGLGLLLGQRRPLRLPEPLAAFAACAAAGLLGAAMYTVAGVPPTVFILLGLCAGALVALGRSLPISARVTLCAVSGLALGLDSGVEAAIGGAARAKTLVATWISLSLCVVNAAFYVSRLPARQWVQTGVRVVGAWIVAIGVLMLAFALRR